MIIFKQIATDIKLLQNNIKFPSNFQCKVPSKSYSKSDKFFFARKAQ